MVNLYFHTNDPSKRKAVQWFAKHDIALTQRNIEKEPLSAAEIQQLLTISLNGTDDLVAQRSRETKALKIDPDQMTLNELTAAIQKSPHILKNPIIFSENKLITGFDKEKMGLFISKQQRCIELKRLLQSFATPSPQAKPA